MATKTAPMPLDLGRRLEGALSQFRGLNLNEPGQWPLLPRLAAWAIAALAALVAAWFVVLQSSVDELDLERNREPDLKVEYRGKLSQAVNLGELRKQKLQVQEYVTQLEKQLPGKAEMDALLSDINQAGLGRGLLFELFRPGQVEVKDYYAELPIAIRVTGRYHDVGAFTADVANLSRIVTLHNLTIGPVTAKDTSGVLSMEATARTYRYLDAAEVAEQRKAASAREKSTKKKGASK